MAKTAPRTRTVAAPSVAPQAIADKAYSAALSIEKKEVAPPASPAVQKVLEEKIKAKAVMPGTRKKAGEENVFKYAGSSDGMRSKHQAREKVLNFFLANPTGVFTYKEVQSKLAKDPETKVSLNDAWCSTRDLTDMEDLVEEMKGNQKGHRLHPNLVPEAKEMREEAEMEVAAE